ncbi:MAG: MBL fold metallo-hydrolase [Haloarculaceae archaeon]
MDRLPLRNEAFEGRNNAYLLTDDDKPTTLVDTGVASSTSRAALEDQLAEHDVTVEDIDEILVTHWHEDHAGLVGEIQAESGATVRAHEDDASLVATDPDALERLFARYEERLDQWAVPDEPREALLSHLTKFDGGGARATVEPFTDGDTVSEYELEAVHLPGHTVGLCGFVADGDVLFSGDALLPRYTPNVGGADVRMETPLAAYLGALQRIIDRDFSVAYPGHRDRIEDPTDRAHVIADHHRDRTENVLEVLEEEGAATAWTVSDRLFGDLESIHILHGPGEAWAHLDHLERHGVVTRDDRRYERVVEDVDVDALFDVAD